MLKIGITGGIGSGKTTVCKVFESLGIPVFNADLTAKKIMVEDAFLIEEVKSAFGKDSYLENKVLNSKHIADIVFNDINALTKLNSIVHPAVFRAFETWVKEMPSNVPYVLKEAALLFESGADQMCDHTILVTAPLTSKLARVMKRDGVTEMQVKARMNKQFTDKQKLKMADYFIENNENHSLILQVLALHQQFLSL